MSLESKLLEIRKSDREMTPLKFAGDEFVFWREATQMYSVRTGLLRMSLKPELLEKRKSDRDMTPPKIRWG